MKENRIEEDIELLQDETSSLGLFFKCKGSEKYKIALEHILSDYKRVLKINEVLLKENEEIRIKNNAIKRESEAYLEHMIRLDNELNLEKEKSKYEWIRQNCLSQELVNKLYIPIQKIKDRIEDKIAEIEADKLNYGEDDWYLESELKGYAIDKLKELLESEE